MPSKNRIKIYELGMFYHIYNRGVEKREIFLERNDYEHFVYKLRACLKPLPKHTNHSQNITLIAYSLMPNHFHLIVRNERQRGIEDFMRSLGTFYSMYFNKKYERVGHLFQGPYKAANIRSEGELLHKVRYVHKNPLDICEGPLKDYPYSNYNCYLQEKETDWFDIRTVLHYFQGKGFKYKEFVENLKDYP